MLRIFLILLILLPLCTVQSQSPDADGDGICDENDACPRIAGIADHHGCPGITKEVLDADTKRQEDQFITYINTMDFRQLSGLVVQNIDNRYFNSGNLLSNDIVIISFKITGVGNDIGSPKPQLPEDDETLRLKLENSVWNKKNFEYFLKKNPGKKVLTACSYGNGNNIRMVNFDSDHFPLRPFAKGKVIAPLELLNNNDERLYYYTAHHTDNKEISVDRDIVHRYGGLTIYIPQIKKTKVRVGYYYNFRTWKSKNFQLINNRWKEISDMEYDKI